jgi:hypothetical protein
MIIFLLFIFVGCGIFVLVGNIWWSLLFWFFIFLFVIIFVILIKYFLFLIFLVFVCLWGLVGFVCFGFYNWKLDEGKSPMTADRFSTSYTIVGTVWSRIICGLYVCHHTVTRILMQSLKYV